MVSLIVISVVGINEFIRYRLTLPTQCSSVYLPSDFDFKDDKYHGFFNTSRKEWKPSLLPFLFARTCTSGKRKTLWRSPVLKHWQHTTKKLRGWIVLMSIYLFICLLCMKTKRARKLLKINIEAPKSLTVNTADHSCIFTCAEHQENVDF